MCSKNGSVEPAFSAIADAGATFDIGAGGNVSQKWVR